ncbi:MAG: anthranilate synthase component I [Acidimicrobiales bacterium]
MLKPDRPAFRLLAASHAIVPVWREILCDLITPVAAFLRLVGDRPGFLLESVEHERWGRFSFVGRDPSATLVARPGHIALDGRLPPAVPLDRGVLAALAGLLGAYRSPALDDLPPLHGGVVGYLGYDVVREVERLPEPPPDDQGMPDAVLSVIGELAAFDHWLQRVTLVANVVIDPAWGPGDLDQAYDEAAARIEALAADGARPLDEPVFEPPDPRDPPPQVRRTVPANEWAGAVAAAREHIAAGDIFQVVLSQRFDFDLGADPFDVYRVLRQVNPSPYMYFLRHPEVTVVGSSPEPMVRLDGHRVVSRPIAGTRRRGRTPDEDRRLAGELAEHPKERAEHVMLVDLARNDVGRVVDFGSEQVDELMTLERYSHVMHLTSQVSGRLAPGLGPIDVLRATLPAGTVSGAPKVRAMQIIDALEPTRRGPYAGVVGYLDFSGNLDTAIAIRTMFVRPGGRASVQAGAGIVADSEPEAEDLECRNKAAALLAAVPAARRMAVARGLAPPEPPRRETALVVPVPEAEALVGRWRDRLDRSASHGVPAHITLVYPFVEPSAINDALQRDLRTLFAAVEPFSYSLAEIRWFGRQVVFIAPEPPGPFSSIAEALADRYGTPPYGGAYADIVPHLTVGQGADLGRLEEAADAVAADLPLAATATEAWLIEGDPAGWATRARFRLGAGADR